MDIPKNLFFTKDHEWARIEGKRAVIGITDYAQHSLGDITFVDLPKIGDIVKQGGRSATVESVKAASDVYAPFSGKVISVNEALVNAPQLINESMYDKGYFFVVEIKDESEKGKLMDASAYANYVKGLSE